MKIVYAMRWSQTNLASHMYDSVGFFIRKFFLAPHVLESIAWGRLAPVQDKLLSLDR